MAEQGREFADRRGIAVVGHVGADDVRAAGVQMRDPQRLIVGFAAGAHEQHHGQRGVETGGQALTVVEDGFVQVAGVSSDTQSCALRCALRRHPVLRTLVAVFRIQSG